MTILLTAIHVIVALFLIIVVLLQTGKRADLAGAFGGGGSQTAFGTRGAATVLSKATTGAAVIFMLTSIGLAVVSARPDRDTGSVLEEVEQSSPAAPALPEEGSELPPLPPLDEPAEESGSEPEPTDGAP
jgi:preprotein translocase subunit SecG